MLMGSNVLVFFRFVSIEPTNRIKHCINVKGYCARFVPGIKFLKERLFFPIFSQNRKTFLKRVVIIGGGLAGLTCAHQLARAGVSCTLIEKKAYPFHRVCGEYISNEVVPFLRSSGLYPTDFNPPQIKNFLLSAVNGQHEKMKLDLGGFGISRFTFDNFIFNKAQQEGAEFLLNEEVEKVIFNNDKFKVSTTRREIEADVVVGTFGKRSKMDRFLSRRFLNVKSPYVAVKYHVRNEHPDDLIALHNFSGGYCGMSNIEEKKTTLCYLTHRDVLKRFKSILAMEQAVLLKNPFLRQVFTNSEFLYQKPEVINEVSFVTKSPIEDHILMAGDSAGMIAPLCGNGMAMAIHSGKILSELIIEYVDTSIRSRNWLEQNYINAWNAHFKRRLFIGRQVQRLFGNRITSQLAVGLAISSRPLASLIIKNTHGEPF
jgi:flavin-dependent dehydrogenase